MDTDQHLLVKTLENYDTFFGETKNMSDDYDHDDEEKICWWNFLERSKRDKDK